MIKYELDNGKVVNIPKAEIKHYMAELGMKEQDAIDMWLDDHDLQENEDLEELDAKASQVKISHGASAETKAKSERKPRTIVVSDQKQKLFTDILANLQSLYGTDVKVVKDNKLITVDIDGKIFKIDLVETRAAKGV